VNRPGVIYLGHGAEGPVWAGEEQSVLVLGPPRSGKTSGIVVPTVLSAPGAVVSTSTKPDVLSATLRYRARLGECLVFDPSGTVDVPAGARRIGWSPIPACTRWDDALLVARALVGATGTSGERHAPSDHWSERAEALLAPLLHAAALTGEQLPTLLSWVDRRQPAVALGVLDEAGHGVAADLLTGIVATEAREQSGIWSTASGVLAGYRSDAALANTVENPVNALEFCSSVSTLYVCATGRQQALVAPMVVGLLTEIRAATYHEHARRARSGDAPATPVVLALDEVANIAPIPDLPSMVSEGGGQGLLTLACLQDLSQARLRWGPSAEGFLSLFGTTVVLAGIGDVRTLRALSALAGEEDVPTRSVSAPAVPGGWTGLAGKLLGRGRQVPVATVTVGTRLEPRLAVDVLGRGRPGMAMVVDERNRMGWVGLTPWFASEPWRTMVEGRELERPEPGLELGRAAGRGVDLGRGQGAAVLGGGPGAP
jgi:type IV secretory pathway TraG/TraD family ATPase VirD4